MMVTTDHFLFETESASVGAYSLIKDLSPAFMEEVTAREVALINISLSVSRIKNSVTSEEAITLKVMDS